MLSTANDKLYRKETYPSNRATRANRVRVEIHLPTVVQLSYCSPRDVKHSSERIISATRNEQRGGWPLPVTRETSFRVRKINSPK